MDELKTLTDTVTKLTSSIEATSAKVDTVIKAQEQSRTNFGVPNIIVGERGERPFEFQKALGLLAGQVSPENAKTEVHVSDMLKKYHDGYSGYTKAKNSVMLPMASWLVSDDKVRNEVQDLTKGHGQIDLDELRFMRKKLEAQGMTKALSWIDNTAAGITVAPPALGEFIELLRNNEVLMPAGARVLPLPPQGRIVYPRQTSAMTAYHVGENSALTSSDLGTGDVQLQAKKLTILAKMPNELFHFSSIPIEGLIRQDMAKIIGLKMDLQLLEGVGSTTAPKGLINYSNIATVTNNGTAADSNSGYTIHPKDVSMMIATVEEQNATFKAFIMRPMLWATLFNRRADAVSGGDAAGPFLFNITRDIGMDVGADKLKVGNLMGYSVFKSTQLSKVRTRGTGTTNNTYVLGGDFNDYIIGMGPALEFALNTQGDTPFVNDQTWFRGIMYYDGAPRHEASFALLDNLLQST